MKALICLALLIYVSGDITVFAQNAALALLEPNAFREAFVASPSGSRSSKSANVLVGVRIGGVSGLFNPDTVRVRMGSKGLTSNVCVRAFARDGRYSASAIYRGPTGAGSHGLEMPTRYGAELRSYAASDIAFLAYSAPDCDPAKATELLVVGHGQDSEAVVVQVSAPASRVRAMLQPSDGAAQDAVVCAPIEGGPRIAFTSECRLSLANVKDGSFRLVLVETTSAGASQTRSFPLRIAR